MEPDNTTTTFHAESATVVMTSAANRRRKELLRAPGEANALSVTTGLAGAAQRRESLLDVEPGVGIEPTTS